eukprot:m.11957 g.11957  ORF g.11957 m.11957 type:complete len:708 (+) comp4563_c0_seq2:125-2248(+)
MAFFIGVAIQRALAMLGLGPEDPHEWLENVTSDSALDWAKERNAHALRTLGNPHESKTYEQILKILDSKDKIPYVKKIGDKYYNLWQDKKHLRGLWRRTTLEEFQKPDTQWETVLDLDALNEKESENWTWKGSTPCDLGPDVHTDLVLLRLSRGGADAVVVREFNVDKKEFVTENAFFLPEAKSSVCYKSRDVLLVGTDMEEGSLTDSGYPRTVREWRRGTKLESSVEIFSGEKEDVAVSGYSYYDRGHTYELVDRAMTFYTSQKFLRRDGKLIKVEVPDDTELSTFAGHFLISLRKEWKLQGKVYPSGSLLSAPVDSLIAGDTSDITPLFVPGERTSLEHHVGTLNYLVLIVLDNVQTKLQYWKYDHKESTWINEERSWSPPDMARVSAIALSPDEDDQLWLIRTGFTAPTTLFLGSAAGNVDPVEVKQLPAQFNATGLRVSQGEAVSKDGTRIPYFMIAREDMKLDKSNPTLLYGYGGFEISLLPYYMASVGVGWLERGGIFVQANIRGGGEFGPKWHQAALKEKRHKAYEDFIAVAEHLLEEGVTSRQHLAIQGGSNGGLLVGNMLTMRPDLWGAVVCQVPLLDMKKFNKLLAGASWMGEYGNPDIPEEWAFLKAYSPYHNVKKETKYPPTLFTTSTRDDRVHPGHARKMVARMIEYQGTRNVTYYENIEGGHGGAADNKQRAFMTTLTYKFLSATIGKKMSSL